MSKVTFNCQPVIRRIQLNEQKNTQRIVIARHGSLQNYFNGGFQKGFQNLIAIEAKS